MMIYVPLFEEFMQQQTYGPSEIYKTVVRTDRTFFGGKRKIYATVQCQNLNPNIVKVSFIWNESKQVADLYFELVTVNELNDTLKIHTSSKGNLSNILSVFDQSGDSLGVFAALSLEIQKRFNQIRLIDNSTLKNLVYNALINNKQINDGSSLFYNFISKTIDYNISNYQYGKI